MTENKNSLFADNDNTDDPEQNQDQQNQAEKTEGSEFSVSEKALAEEVKLSEDLSFEEALQALEEIVQELEGDVLSLEESMEKYSRGMKLISFCQQELNRAEGRIEQVLEKHGELREIIPFEIAED